MRTHLVNLIVTGSGLVLLCMLGCSNEDGSLSEDETPSTRPFVAMDRPFVSTFGGIKLPDESEDVVDSVGDISAFAEPALIEANTKFAFKLFAEVYKQEPGVNLLISPVSVSIALTMTYNGALGETQKAMAKTLELRGMDLQFVNGANAGLLQTLEFRDPKVELRLANSIWINQGHINPKPDFLERNRQFFGARVETLNFSEPQSAIIINGWVGENTNHKIKNIVPDPMPGNIVMILINAIYFKGLWEVDFAKSKTEEGIFHLRDGTEKQVPMMFKESNDLYFATDTFAALRLPYGTGQVSMYIFLPHKHSTLETFLSHLNAENWEHWMSKFDEMAVNPPFQRAVEIQLPRFKIEYDAAFDLSTGDRNLNSTLVALGMGIAFTPGANFGGLAPGVWISLVKHKTFIEVNEEGTEAAGVTAVFLIKSGNFHFTADRPFFFAIRDGVTKTILFMGVVVEPM